MLGSAACFHLEPVACMSCESDCSVSRVEDAHLVEMQSVT